MASEIHKKRTGKGFKVTEEIVAKEDIYEEEDEDLPRLYRLLSANMETSSADMNARLEAYLSNHLEVSEMLGRANDEWRNNKINRLFAQSFPNAALVTEQMAQSMPNTAEYKETHEGYCPAACPSIPCSSPARIAEQATAPATPTSITHQHRAAVNSRRSRASASPATKDRRNSFKGTSSPEPAITRTTPSTSNTISPQTLSNFASLDKVTFITELPPEARMLLAGVGTDAIIVKTPTIQETQEHQMGLNPQTMHDPLAMLQTTQNSIKGTGLVPKHCGNIANHIIASKHFMPCILDDDPWQSFFNDSIWATNY